MIWLRNVTRDFGEGLRYAVRQYAKEPCVTIVLLITMALGTVVALRRE